LDGIGILDFEWSKKTLRRMSLRVHPENLLMQNKVLFRIPADLKTMRLTLKEKSWRLSPSSPIDIHPGERYLLDRFEH
jgi:hypothetical protein